MTASHSWTETRMASSWCHSQSDGGPEFCSGGLYLHLTLARVINGSTQKLSGLMPRQAEAAMSALTEHLSSQSQVLSGAAPTELPNQQQCWCPGRMTSGVCDWCRHWPYSTLSSVVYLKTQHWALFHGFCPDFAALLASNDCQGL